MNSRFNYVAPKKRDSSKDDVFETYELKERIIVISTNKDGSVDKFKKESFYERKENSWREFIESYDLGSVSDQVINHLTKGTPLITGHTLPPADYTKIGKGAEIRKEMLEKGVSFEMVVQAVKEALASKEKTVVEKPIEKPVENTGESV